MFGVPSRKFLYHMPLERSPSNSIGSLFANFPPLETDDMRSDVNPTWLDRGEVFVFDYGVLVLWNFTEHEEVAFLTHIKNFTQGRVPADDMEREDFHFQYDIGGPFQPRIFNDMITLKSSSALIKLTISHGLSQSVKLSHFENMMEETIQGTLDVSHL
jgi:uncharacterized Rmd1/YagE family protein